MKSKMEELNNDVLDRWADESPDKAWPNTDRLFLTREQLKKLADWARAKTTAYGPKFDAAFDVAIEIAKKLHGWVPCSPGCPGVAVFDADFEPPTGYVHIERCDQCDRFENDDEAAAWLVGEKNVHYVCVACMKRLEAYIDDNLMGDLFSVETLPMTFEESEHHGGRGCRFRVVIETGKALEALKEGKLLPWSKEPVTDQQ